MQRVSAIVVSGELGAGKSTAAKYLASSSGFEHLSFVERLWLPVLAERGIEPSRHSLQQLGIELVERVGIERLVDQLMATRNSTKVVIDDARRRDVVDRLRELVDVLVHVHLVADFDTRFPRLVERDGVRSESEQRRAETVSTETTIADLQPIADHVIHNTGSLEDLYARLDSIVKSVGS